MKLPWDEKYLKISFHVIFTLIIVYALMVIVDGVTYLIANFNIIGSAISSTINGFFSVFSSVIVAFIIAYLFDPAVDFFQKHYMILRDKRLIPFIKKYPVYKMIKRRKKSVDYGRRTAGTILLYLTFFLSVGLIITFVFSKIGSSMSNFSVDSIGTIIKNTRVEFEYTIASIGVQLKDWGVLDYVSDYFTDFVTQVTVFLSTTANNGVSALTSAGGSIVSFLLSIVIAFYFLQDKASIKRRICDIADVVIPAKINRGIKYFFSDVHNIFSGYIRGQLIDACIMALLLGTFLSIIGVRFAPLIGLLSGISNLIPYFGAIICFVLAVSVALLSGQPLTALYAAIGLLILQQIDGIFIVPRVVGKNVELSPVMVLISLSVAGAVFGIPGMIFAVPVFAIVKMFLERYIQRRKEVMKQRIVNEKE